MWASLQKVAALDDALPIFPGHGYSGWGSTVGHEKEVGLLRPVNLFHGCTPVSARGSMMGVQGRMYCVALSSGVCVLITLPVHECGVRWLPVWMNC
jgi:hypothetical protein